MITGDDKLANILIKDHNLIPVMTRFNISRGIGDQTIYEICKESGINTDLLLTVLNLLSNNSFSFNKKTNPYYVLPLMDYLRKAHEDYLRIQTANIERHIGRLIASADSSGKNLQLLFSLFAEYKQELTCLIAKEEQEVFSYILYVYELFYSPGYAVENILKRPQSIKELKQEYVSVNEKLRDLISLMIKYLTGSYDENIFYAVILSLNRLKDDISGTQRLEEKFLLPLVSRMEKEIYKRNNRK